MNTPSNNKQREILTSTDHSTHMAIFLFSKQQQQQTQQQRLAANMSTSTNTFSSSGGSHSHSNSASRPSSRLIHQNDNAPPKSQVSKKLSNNFLSKLVEAVEQFEKERRLREIKKRISETQLTLRAATQLRLEQEQQQQQQQLLLSTTMTTTTAVPSDTMTECCWTSDLGTALLYPLPTTPIGIAISSTRSGGNIRSFASAPAKLDQQELLRRHSASMSGFHNVNEPPLPQQQQQQQQQQQRSQELLNDDEEETTPVYIEPEPEADGKNPRLLSPTQFRQLVDEGIPSSMRMNAWRRIYSIGRDGDSFYALLQKCKTYPHNLIVIQTTTGYLLGGFNSSAWKTQKKTSCHDYYGNGVSFLFGSHPAADDCNNSTNNSERLSIYKWTGTNDLCQICNQEERKIAMGGGGAFGFILKDDFFRGSTDRCGTFGNPPLTRDPDGLFTVAAMEIYGLVPYDLNNSVRSSCREVLEEARPSPSLLPAVLPIPRALEATFANSP